MLFIVIILILGLTGCNSLASKNTQIDESEYMSPVGEGLPQIVYLGMDRNGYTPKQITVKAGEPVTIKREDSLRGCAVYVVQPQLGINANFNQNEEYIFTPTKKGKFTYSCSMGMFRGIIVVV